MYFGTNAPGFYSAGQDRAVKWHDWESERTEVSPVTYQGPVFDLALSPDGRELVAASWFGYSESGEVRILDARTLAESRVFPATVGRVFRVAISADGRTLATAGAEGVARLWDFETGASLADFYGHQMEITALTFSGRPE